MLKLKEPEESESELEHRSSRVRSSKVGVGYKRETSLVPRLLYAREPGNEAKAKLDGTTIASFPGRSRLQFLIAYCMQKRRGKAWEKVTCVTSGRREGRH